MSVSRSITFNDVTATVTFDNKLNDNKLSWNMSMISGANKTSTNDMTTIIVPTSVPVVASIPVVASVPMDEKTKHIAHIKDMLDECEKTVCKSNMTVIFIKILDYVSGNALEFTKAHERFKEVVINKCYEFKTVNSDMPDVVTKADAALIKLGSSTTIPLNFKIANTIIRPSPAPAPAPASTVKNDTSYNPEIALFVALAKKYGAENAILDPIKSFSYYETACKTLAITGTTKAEKMVNYFTRWSDLYARIQLMKSLFTKNNIVFTDTAMILYNEWVKTYKPTDKTNRYKKICAFIDAHKSLFTT